MLEELAREIRAIAPRESDLKKFGLTFLVILAAIGAYLIWKGKGPPWAPPALFGLAGACGFLGLLRPAWLAGFYKGWMTLASVMGFFASRLILSVVFFLLITPIGLFSRLLHKDWLDMKMGDRDSYWHIREGGEYEPGQSEKMY